MSTGTVWRGHGFMAREYHWPRFIQEVAADECQSATPAVEEVVRKTIEVSRQEEGVLVGSERLPSHDFGTPEDFQSLTRPSILVG